MTLGEALVYAVGGGGAVKVIDFAIFLLRSRRRTKVIAASTTAAEARADADVAIASIDAFKGVIAALNEQIAELRDQQEAERAACNAKLEVAAKEAQADRHAAKGREIAQTIRIVAMETELRETKRGREDCERRTEAVVAEMRELRNTVSSTPPIPR